MSASNGHAKNFELGDAPDSGIEQQPGDLAATPALYVDPQVRINNLLEELQVPFDPALMKWRVNDFRRAQGRLYGFGLPYADPRAYKDRLNFLLTPVGWTDRYSITTTPTKVLVTCELNIHVLGLHSATGEEWARNENAATAAEAQAFKRACACFGLGRYLYCFEGQWLQLDKDKRPVAEPEIPEWATPDGWRSGLRPIVSRPEFAKRENATAKDGEEFAPFSQHRGKNIIRDICLMAPELGPALYRGILKSVAHAFRPEDIPDIALQHTVLRYMEGARRGLRRAAAAAARLERETIAELFRLLEVDSIEKVSDLETLRTIVLALERAAGLA